MYHLSVYIPLSIYNKNVINSISIKGIIQRLFDQSDSNEVAEFQSELGFL